MIDIDQYKEECYDVVGAIYNVKKELGPGLNEKVYQEGLSIEMSSMGIPFVREFAVHPIYNGRTMESLFYLDFLCKGSVIVELKSARTLDTEHRAQLFNYMHIVKPKVGILVNFTPLYAELERYFYDAEVNRIVDVDGNYIKNKYDNLVTFNKIR